MTTYIVWDSINASEEFAERIEAASPGEAAEKYAEADVDGGIDCIYARAHPIAVKEEGDPDHEIWDVSVEYEPSYHATPAPEPGAKS